MASRRTRRAERAGNGRPGVVRPQRRLSYYVLVAISLLVALSMIVPTCASAVSQ